MQQNDRDTWYDISGRIVFASNVGMSGVSLTRKDNRTTPKTKTKITNPDGKVRLKKN
jgi:hypothetical protein